MNVQKILCLASLVCLTTILPTLLPAQAETLSQDSVEISKEKSSRDGQHPESKDDHDSDHKRGNDHGDDRKRRDDHDKDHDHDKDRDRGDDRDRR
jgi:hypothetical protein